MINSPRSLEACKRIGVEPSELYKLSDEEFKQKFPEVIGFTQKLYQYRYDAEEKFRNETIEQVKEERNKIIKEKEESNENKDGNENKVKNSEETEKKWEKLIENEKKNY